MSKLKNPTLKKYFGEVVRDGWIDAVKEYIGKGLNIHGGLGLGRLDDSYTALHIAVLNHRKSFKQSKRYKQYAVIFEIIKLLIKNKMNVNALAEGLTPLDIYLLKSPDSIDPVLVKVLENAGGKRATEL